MAENRNIMPHYDVIVVGGGASGMMAAGVAGEQGKKVLLLEKNARLGEKLAITGGARCNITNATYDVRTLLENYGDAMPFLFSPFSQFGVKETFSFFESLGLPLVVQANSRAFPKTEKATDVVAVLKKYLQKHGVEVHTKSAVEKILSEGQEITGVVVSGTIYQAQQYILATGGVSHPETGSTGDGFGWLRRLGHTVQEPTPTIVPIKTAEAWSHVLSGVSVNDAKITFYVDGKKSFSKTGTILFTHFGLSGPLILNSAGGVGDLLAIGKVTATIDLEPSLNMGELDKKIINIFNLHKTKQLKNVLREIVPAGVVPGIIAVLQKNQPFDMATIVQFVTKEQRKIITRCIKQLPLTVTGLMGFDRAVVADGGVVLQEVDTRTMRSKKYTNLYITGDLLHINRPSGGYSLQLCWTTGYVAGKQSAKHN